MKPICIHMNKFNIFVTQKKKKKPYLFNMFYTYIHNHKDINYSTLDKKKKKKKKT
ncbi:hypothetical protein HanRHA438_Chr04g0161841 [Helianthus annuus]|nr:hypothetical protein HanRHA438_Chr04g0161841 [Helianthus annuus]